MTSRALRPHGVTVAAIAVILSGIMLVSTALGMLGFLGTVVVPANGGPRIDRMERPHRGGHQPGGRRGAVHARAVGLDPRHRRDGLAIGAAAWALIRRGFEGIVAVSVLSGAVASIVLAYLLQGNVKAAFEA